MKMQPKEKKALHILIHALDPNGYIEEDLQVLAERFSISEDELQIQLENLQSLILQVWEPETCRSASTFSCCGCLSAIRQQS